MVYQYILSVGAGRNQLILINEIKRMGYFVISCDLDPNAPGKELSDIFFNISTHDYNLIIKEIINLGVKLLGVVTRSTGQPVVTTSKIAEKFGLCALNSGIAEILTDKYLFLQKMNYLNAPSPILNIVTNDLNIDQIDFPVFVKPSKTNISHAAMKKCENISELKKAYREASKISQNKLVNIEEYLIGYDLASIDYVFDGEVIHVTSVGEISTGEPNFDGIGWYSCKRNACFDKLAQETFCKIKNVLGIKNGFFQSAMKANTENYRAKVYEIHAEIGGDLVNDIFVPKVTDGYNIFENNILFSLGIKPSYCLDFVKPAVILFRDKINKYSLRYENILIDKQILSDQYVMLFFKSFSGLKEYLEQLSLQENFSVKNK